MKAIVIARDRVDYARRCVDSLINTPDITDLHIVDHGSTYKPMMEWLAVVGGPHPVRGANEMAGRVHVHWRGNDHPRALWTNGTLANIVQDDERFIVTDCDIEPPADPGWVQHLGALLDLNPDAVKAGCGLVTDDLPDEYEHADRARMWEANYQGFNTLRRDKESGLAWYDASVDTTLAMYRRLEPFAIDPSVRTADAKFMARHLTWYEDSSGDPALDVEYYRANMLNGVSHWIDPDSYQGTYGLSTPDVATLSPDADR